MKTFDELDLVEPLHQALAAENYRTPTANQAKTIPTALEGFDISFRSRAFRRAGRHGAGLRQPSLNSCAQIGYKSARRLDLKSATRELST